MAGLLSHSVRSEHYPYRNVTGNNSSYNGLWKRRAFYEPNGLSLVLKRCDLANPFVLATIINPSFLALLQLHPVGLEEDKVPFQATLQRYGPDR